MIPKKLATDSAVKNDAIKDKLVGSREELEELKSRNSELESFIEFVIEHATFLENSLRTQNRDMLGYIEDVKKITSAASSVQNNTFTPESLTSVAGRTDELGNLARVLSDTVQSVKHQERKLIEANDHLSDLLKAYSRFVPHEYLTFLKQKSIIDIQLGDHVSKEMAVMFSDMRAFTALSENMTPQENFDFVNAYLRWVSPEIRNHNGFIVKYLGDGMMAVFPDGSEDALQAGIAKVKRVQEYNIHRLAEGHVPIEVGIGIHYGHMMVGMVGEVNRIQGDAFSDNVNLTSRLEGLTKYYGISLLVSEEALLKVNQPEQYTLRLLDQVIVKGRQEPITIYEVLDADSDEQHVLKCQTLDLYQQGRELYQQGDLSQAKKYFDQVLQINPIDKPVKLYQERIHQLSQQELPPFWNGIWTFTRK